MSSHSEALYKTAISLFSKYVFQSSVDHEKNKVKTEKKLII
jgi:hypothetical protein